MNQLFLFQRLCKFHVCLCVYWNAAGQIEAAETKRKIIKKNRLNFSQQPASSLLVSYSYSAVIIEKREKNNNKSIIDSGFIRIRIRICDAKLQPT